MTQQPVTLQWTDQGVGLITLNRPQVRNALDDASIDALLAHVATLESRSDCPLVVLQGQGQHFSAGADLSWMAGMVTASQQENHADAQRLSDLLDRWHRLPQPTMAWIQGVAYGGAVGLVAASDLALATEQARFCFSEVKLGLVPAVISPYVMQALGQRMCQSLFLTAEVFSGMQAHQWGLVQHLAPEHQLQQQGELLIERLLQHGPQALRHAKQLAQSPISAARRQALVALIAELRVSPEGQAGMQAFLNKQPPPWSTS